jgi:acylpyruvate hydrolase
MKIICIGRNYADHAAELNNPVPKAPLVFMKPDTALLRENRDFYYPDFSKDIHYEVEVVLKIKQHGKHIEPQFAHKYYDQIGLGIDFTARDIQEKCKEKGHPWEIAKAFDSSAVIGDFYSKEKLLDEEGHLLFSLKKNGETVQEGDTRKMLSSFDQLVSYVSKYFMLKKGDLIYTGTPKGVGPIAIGDEFEGYIGERKIFSCAVK